MHALHPVRRLTIHRALWLAVLSLSILLSTLVAAQDASYTFTRLDVPGAEQTEPHGINDEDQIVGLFTDATGGHGFFKDGSTFTTLDAPGATYTEAWGLNNLGQIVGAFFDGTRTHGFLTDGTTFTPINVPGAEHTLAIGINDAGQVIGAFFDATGYHSFLMDGATVTPINAPGAQTTDLWGLNNSGQIVGAFWDGIRQHGLLIDDMTLTTLDVPGATYTDAHGINDEGQIVGGFTAGSTHGFLTDGTTFTTLDVPFSGTQSTRARSINMAGKIVGHFAETTGTHGFLATPFSADRSPPAITIAASPTTLAPKEKLVTVTVSGTITEDEPDDSGVQTGSTVYKVIDEYGQIQPKGSFTLNAGGGYTFIVKLQASRNGNDKDGRHYTIEVSATDNVGNTGTELAIVTVPRK